MRRLFEPTLRLRGLSLLARWSGAVLLVLIAFGIRYALFGPAPALPFLLFFPAIILASVFLDRGSGFIAVAVSTGLSIYFFIEPHFHFALPTTTDTVAVLLFVVTGTNFKTGAAVRLNGSRLNTVFNSSTRLTATGYNATGASGLPVTVLNPDGQVSNAIKVVVTAP